MQLFWGATSPALGQQTASRKIMQTAYFLFFILLASFSAVFSVYLWKSKQRSAVVLTLVSSALLAIVAAATLTYELSDRLFNIIWLAWGGGLVGTTYLVSRKGRVFVLLLIPVAYSIRLFIFVDILLYLAATTLFLGIWNSYDYSRVSIVNLSGSLPGKILLGPFSWFDGILRSRLETKQLRRALFIFDASLSAALVLAPLGIYLLFGFRIVTDVLLIAGVIFFSMGRQQYLRHRGRSGH